MTGSLPNEPLHSADSTLRAGGAAHVGVSLDFHTREYGTHPGGMQFITAQRNSYASLFVCSYRKYHAIIAQLYS